MTQESDQDIDLLLASLRADAADTAAFLQALAVRLDGALPGQVSIERHGGVFSREHRVRRITLNLDESRFALTDEGHGRLAATRVKVVRGIALKTESLDVDAWLAALAAELTVLAESSGRGREALERLLLGR